MKTRWNLGAGIPGRSQYAMLMFVLALMLLEGITLVSRTTGIPVADFTRDPATVNMTKPYVGVLSNLGILVWGATAAVCLMSYLVLRGHLPDRRRTAFLVSSAFISAMLLFDDLLLLHESFYPKYLHVPEKAVFGAYGLIMLAYVIVFRRTIQRTRFIPFVLAGVFFALSIGVDVLPPPLFSQGHLLEDGAKFLGIVSWFVYFTTHCYTEISNALHLAYVDIRHLHNHVQRREVDDLASSDVMTAS